MAHGSAEARNTSGGGSSIDGRGVVPRERSMRLSYLHGDKAG